LYCARIHIGYLPNELFPVLCTCITGNVASLLLIQIYLWKSDHVIYGDRMMMLNTITSKLNRDISSI